MQGCQVWNPDSRLNEFIAWPGKCKDGLATGHGTVAWANGSRYEGNFVDGKLQSKGILETANGEKYEGNFINGKLSGSTILTKIDGSRIAGYSVDGKFYSSTVNSEFATRRLGVDSNKSGVAAKQSSAESGNENADKTCRSYGLEKGTAVYVDCMLRIREQDLKLNGAQSAEQREKDRAEDTQRDRDQELAKQKRQQQLVLACKSAMLLRPTRSGSAGESFVNASQCDADPQAHLRPAPPNYTCRRDTFGNLNCNPY